MQHNLNVRRVGKVKDKTQSLSEIRKGEKQLKRRLAKLERDFRRQQDRQEKRFISE